MASSPSKFGYSKEKSVLPEFIVVEKQAHQDRSRAGSVLASI